MTGRTGGLKNLVTCDQAFEWVRPMKPSPIIATLISRIANLLDRSRNRKPSAEGDVAFTRSSGFVATIAGAQADPKGQGRFILAFGPDLGERGSCRASSFPPDHGLARQEPRPPARMKRPWGMGVRRHRQMKRPKDCAA